MVKRYRNSDYARYREQILEVIQENPGISTSVTHFRRQTDIPDGSAGFQAFRYNKEVLKREGYIKEIKGRFYPASKEIEN